MKARNAIRFIVAIAAGAVATGIAGSVVGTQINLRSITQLGVPVPIGTRIETTAADVVGFGPVMALIALAAFVPAFSAALALGRLLGGWRRPLAIGAGAVGLATAFGVMGFFTPMPTLVAPVRGAFGLLAMSATGMIGGAVFAYLMLDRTRARRSHSAT